MRFVCQLQRCVAEARNTGTQRDKILDWTMIRASQQVQQSRQLSE